MQYMLMFVQADEEVWEKLSSAEQNYPAIERWWGEHAKAGHLVGPRPARAREAARPAWHERGEGGRSTRDRADGEPCGAALLQERIGMH
jgi:hypothetical protein